MESWLLRNVGFYRSFLAFYVLKTKQNKKNDTHFFSKLLCYIEAHRTIFIINFPFTGIWQYAMCVVYFFKLKNNKKPSLK